MSLGQALGQLIAPVLGGASLGFLGLSGVMFLDGASFLIAIGSLLVVRIPAPPCDRAATAGPPRARELRAGWDFVRRRPGLLHLLFLLAVMNFMTGLAVVLIAPLVLSFDTPKALGLVLSMAAAEMVAGSLAMTVWGGPRRRVRGILIALFIEGVCLLLSGLRPSVLLIGMSGFFLLGCGPVVLASSQSLWQLKVPHGLQGRVFALRTMIALSVAPLAFFIAGPLAERVFEPLLATGGALETSVGRWIGAGAGRGIALLLMTAGAVLCAVVSFASLGPRLRHVEVELPDQAGALETK